MLFVAEKTAALDVVYRRLREHGLGNQCVELHSSKADRKHFLGQLKAAWERGNGVDASERVAVNERLRVHRDQLNAYVDALHRRYANGWTPYLALGITLKAGDTPAPDLSWAERDAHDAATLRALEDMAAEAGLVYASVERHPALDLVDAQDWSSGVFIWKKGQIVDVLRYRPSVNEESRRAIADIPLAELASVVIHNHDLLDMPDPARDMARFLGVERLAATARARLDEAIARARLHMAGQDRSS